MPKHPRPHLPSRQLLRKERSKTYDRGDPGGRPCTSACQGPRELRRSSGARDLVSPSCQGSGQAQGLRGSRQARPRTARRGRSAPSDAAGGVQPRGSHDLDAAAHPTNAGGPTHAGQGQVQGLGELKCTPHVNERLPGGSSQREDPRAHLEATRLRGAAPDEYGSVEAEERHKNQLDCSPGGVRSSAIQERRLRQARGAGSQVLTAVRYFRIMVAQAAPSPQRPSAEDALK